MDSLVDNDCGQSMGQSCVSLQARLSDGLDISLLCGSDRRLYVEAVFGWFVVKYTQAHRLKGNIHGPCDKCGASRGRGCISKNGYVYGPNQVHTGRVLMPRTLKVPVVEEYDANERKTMLDTYPLAVFYNWRGKHQATRHTNMGRRQRPDMLNQRFTDE